jgi:hypothetical protein
MWGPKRLLRLVLRPKRLLLLRPKLVLNGVRKDAKADARSGVKSGALGASASEYGLIAADVSVAIIVATVGGLFLSFGPPHKLDVLVIECGGDVAHLHKYLARHSKTGSGHHCTSAAATWLNRLTARS